MLKIYKRKQNKKYYKKNENKKEKKKNMVLLYIKYILFKNDFKHEPKYGFNYIT